VRVMPSQNAGSRQIQMPRGGEASGGQGGGSNERRFAR
jgi:hypothetical protein